VHALGDKAPWGIRNTVFRCGYWHQQKFKGYYGEADCSARKKPLTTLEKHLCTGSLVTEKDMGVETKRTIPDEFERFRPSEKPFPETPVVIPTENSAA
jgi:hypothetical protein